MYIIFKEDDIIKRRVFFFSSIQFYFLWWITSCPYRTILLLNQGINEELRKTYFDKLIYVGTKMNGIGRQKIANDVTIWIFGQSILNRYNGIYFAIKMDLSSILFVDFNKKKIEVARFQHTSPSSKDKTEPDKTEQGVDDYVVFDFFFNADLQHL